MKLLLFITAGVIGILGFGLLEGRSKKKKIESVFAGRPQRTAADFYTSFFTESGIPEEIVSGVREVLEEILGADLSRINDSDDFSKNLAFFWDFDSMADVEIVCDLEERFSIKITDEEAVATHTVRDIVELVWRKVQENA